ncbi:carboxymuconolactone decarboxylase family protein [Halorussus aquaticus]|uniref:Carboxymuconolactone decarboxylase family protein n=1 Tax=Halorussus aquaticus TaxID=2953748 RepID=A0ABD5Q6H0_9EURY|nr:carboxymuconolactone decarboxylase family protein [Halorussus aquaticus]
MARIPYVDQEELPVDKQSLLDTLSDETDPSEDRGHSLRGGTLNVYRAMANNVALLEAFQTYGSAVWDESGLSPREREFVILSVAFRTRSRYEWHQHVRVALDEGVSPDDVRAVSSGDHDRLEPEIAAIVDYVAEFVDGSVDDATHDRITAHYDDEEVLGIGMLAGTYLGLARVLDALTVDTEVEFVGWDLENL